MAYLRFGPEQRPQILIPTLTGVRSAYSLTSLLNNGQSWFDTDSRPTEQAVGSLQSQINAASGGTCTPTPGVYRESITVPTSTIVDGQNGAVIVCGSDDFSTGGGAGNAWTLSGGIWTSTVPVTNFTRNDMGDTNYYDTFQGKNLEQVFINGMPLKHVAGTPTSGQFTLDVSRHVQIADDPTGKLIEVTQRNTWGTMNTSSTLQGMVFRHVASSPNTSRGIGNFGSNNLTARNCWFIDAHGTGLEVGNSNNAIVDGCTFLRCGAIGLGGSGSGLVITRNRFYYCAQGGYNSGGTDAVAGAMKFTGASGTFSRNVIGHCGNGMWFDIGSTNCTIDSNVIHNIDGIVDVDGQSGMGGSCFSYEISQGTTVLSNNLIWNPNATTGHVVFISSSSGVEIKNNTIVWPNYCDGVYVVQDGSRANTFNVSVHDNTFISLNGDGNWPPLVSDGFHAYNLGLIWRQFNGGTNMFSGNNNTGNNNGFWWASPSPSADSGLIRWEWNSTQYTALASFAATAGGTSSFYLSDAQKNAALAPILNWIDP